MDNEIKEKEENKLDDIQVEEKRENESNENKNSNVSDYSTDIKDLDADRNMKKLNKLRKRNPELSEEELLNLFTQMRRAKVQKQKIRLRRKEIIKRRIKDSTKIISFGLLVCILLGFIYMNIYDHCVYDQVKPEYMSFSEFKEKVENNEVYALYSYDKETYRIKLIKDVPERCKEGNKAKYTLLELGLDNWYETQNVTYENLNEFLAEHNIPIIVGTFKTLTTRVLLFIGALISAVLPFVLLFLLFFMLFSPTGFMEKDKINIVNTSNVRFKDIIGHEEVIDDLKLYVGLLKSPGAAKRLGVSIPKGMIFNGPPGTGKTLIAKALAGEAGVPFIYINASNVIELYVGLGARTIRKAFKKARKMAPCVVFIDEIDAIGGKRGRWGTSSEDTQTINALLQELDGFTEMDNVLVIAATNNIGSLDDALLRSGRFDRKLEILPPKDKLTRLELLELYTNKLLLAPDVRLNKLAEQIIGFTGADVKVLCNEAALIALQKGLKEVTQDNFFEAIDRMLLKGNRVKEKQSNSPDKKLVAYHEAGHAVMCYLLNMPIMRASIQSSTSGVGGFVIPADNDSMFQTKQDILNMIKVAYAGRASESIYRGDACVTNGASNDIQRATQLLQTYLLQYGFDEEIGMLDVKTLIENNICDNKLILNLMQKESKNCFLDVKIKLRDNYILVKAVAEELLEKGVLTGEEFTAVIEKAKVEMQKPLDINKK